MVVLKQIDPMSAIRIAAVVYLVAGFVAALFIVPFFVFFIKTSPFTGIGALLLLIIIPISALVAGSIIVGIGAIVYNFIVEKVGGINIQLKSGELKSVEPFSLGKIAAIGGAIGGFILGVIFTVAFSAVGSSAASAGVGAIGALGVVGIALVIILPIVFAIAFFIIYVVVAIVYNFISSKMGGIMLYFKGKELTSVGVMSLAKIAGVIGAIEGFVQAVIVLLQSSSTASAAQFSMYANVVHALGIFSIVAFPVFYFILSFVVALVEGIVYNFVAKKVGGVKLTLV